MPFASKPCLWDALVISASNASQAATFREILDRRRRLGLIGDVAEVMVTPDPEDRRVGSAGSTVFVLAQVVSKLLACSGNKGFSQGSGGERGTTAQARLESVLEGQRILIIHAGGDSRRLPAYSSCGKVFVPLPGPCDSVEPLTLLDRQLPIYQALPGPGDGAGQVVMASGDVLLLFDPSGLELTGPGVTGTACYAAPAQASGHGVFCRRGSNRVGLFLQKPSEQVQREKGAVDEFGNSLLDIGLMGFDHCFAARLLAMFGFDISEDGAGLTPRAPPWEPCNAVMQAALTHGLDFYREIACAMGEQAEWQFYREQVRAAGSTVPEGTLRLIFDCISSTPFRVRLVPQCRFLHFGTSWSVIESGRDLLLESSPEPIPAQPVIVNSVLRNGRVTGGIAWVEGCRIMNCEVALEGENLLTGADLAGSLRLKRSIALDVAPAKEIGGDSPSAGARFLRIYGVSDTFKGSQAQGNVTYLNRPIEDWLSLMDTDADALWPGDIRAEERSLWNARVFPLLHDDEEVYQWLWMQEPESATCEQRKRWLAGPRFSLAQMADLVDHAAETARRRNIRMEVMSQSLPNLAAPESCFSAKDLAQWLSHAERPNEVIARMIEWARDRWLGSLDPADGIRARSLESVRILHSLGSAIEEIEGNKDVSGTATGPMSSVANLDKIFRLPEAMRPTGRGLLPCGAQDLKSAAFHMAAEVITGLPSADHHAKSGRRSRGELPRLRLRSDEIVWGRCPARLDLAGGWTDTPPYTLEHGGHVVNTAVCLNGQQPIQVYARPLEERIIRIGSIDLGTRIEVCDLENLLDYRSATSDFALVKAALALMGFSPRTAPWPENITLERILEDVGAGLEISTLCAIPKGSGLGTSSILGATVLAVLARALGRQLEGRELFAAVLSLEQMLTTGGGWQDQIGGVLPGTKYIATQPGLWPDPAAYYLPSDLVCPTLNAGMTLLYYTGITRVARNILQQVVGRYLDRDRNALRTLRSMHQLAGQMRDVLSRKAGDEFGRMIDRSWKLNKELDPDSTTPEVEAILATISSHIFGAKLLGAGGGGFLFIACKSPQDAEAARAELTRNPVNTRARFFDFNVSNSGLQVTIS